jgi:hypothetical protein
LKGTQKQLQYKKSLKIYKKNSDLVKKVLKMSVSDNYNQEHKDTAQTHPRGSAKLDWFLSSDVSTFKDFKDLAHENLNSIESVHNANDVEFVEVSHTKRPNSKNNEQKLTLPKRYKLGPSQVKIKNKFEPLARLNAQNDTAPSQTPIKVPPIYLEAENTQ